MMVNQQTTRTGNFCIRFTRWLTNTLQVQASSVLGSQDG